MANPNTKQIERQGLNTEAYTHRYPNVRGGVCDWCGIMNPDAEAKDQYKYCEHYRGMQLSCSYCPASKNPDEVIYKTVLKIADSPTAPGQLVVWCDSYECSASHLERFKRSR